MAQRLRHRQLLADLQDFAQVAALDELHHDVVLVRRLVVAHGQDFDDVGVLQRLADAAFAGEQVDALLDVLHGRRRSTLRATTRPARDLGPEDAAETAGGDFVEQPIAAQHIAVFVAFEEFAALIRRQPAFAFQGAQHRHQVGRAAPHFVLDLGELFPSQETHLDAPAKP